MQYYEYRHTVSFEETSLAGSVYYANHLRWQGRCREMFLREHVPEVVELLENGFELVTMRVSCEYLAQLLVFDQVVIRMRLATLKQNRITMSFEYWRVTKDGEELIARGEQVIACMRRQGKQAFAVSIPTPLRNALALYEADT